MRSFVVVLIFVFSHAVWAKKPNPQKVLEEGQFLYMLERASWVASEHFLYHFPEKADSVTGYFSYQSGDEIFTLFYYKFDKVRLFARYRFQADQPEQVSGLPQSKNLNATSYESDLISIREEAATRIKRNRDGLFTIYDNIPFNLIPIIRNNEKKVLVLSGLISDDFLFMGNDYLLNYNRKNEFRGMRRLHEQLIKLPLNNSGLNQSANATMHTHSSRDIITSSDIAILLLYKAYVGWKLHYVMGKKYVSVFDLEKEALAIVKRKDWKRITTPE